MSLLVEQESSYENDTNSSDIIMYPMADDERIGLPDGLRYTFICAYGVLFVVGVVSNLLVISFVIVHKRMQTMTNKFLTNLSLADLLIVLICIPVTGSSQYFYEQWELGPLLCQATNFVHAVAVSVSVLSLTAVSLDRYLIICQPIRARSIITKCRIRVTIAAIWLISLALMSPLLFVFKYEKQDIEVEETNQTFSVKKCFEVWPSLELKLTFEVLLVLVLLILPSVFMIKTFMKIKQNLWLNSFILGTALQSDKHIRKRNRQSSLIGRESVFSAFNTEANNPEEMLFFRPKSTKLVVNNLLKVQLDSARESNTESLNRASRGGSSSTKSSKSFESQHDYSLHGVRVRYSSRNEMAIIKLIESRKRVVKALILLTSIFLLSWLPYHITSILIDILLIWNRLSDSSITTDYSPGWTGPWVQQASVYIYPFTLLLALTNSSTNPLCFMLLSHRFRVMLKSRFDQIKRSVCFNKTRLDIHI